MQPDFRSDDVGKSMNRDRRVASGAHINAQIGSERHGLLDRNMDELTLRQFAFDPDPGLESHPEPAQSCAGAIW